MVVEMAQQILGENWLATTWRVANAAASSACWVIRSGIWAGARFSTPIPGPLAGALSRSRGDPEGLAVNSAAKSRPTGKVLTVHQASGARPRSVSTERRLRIPFEMGCAYLLLGYLQGPARARRLLGRPASACRSPDRRRSDPTRCSPGSPTATIPHLHLRTGTTG